MLTATKNSRTAGNKDLEGEELTFCSSSAAIPTTRGQEGRGHTVVQLLTSRCGDGDEDELLYSGATVDDVVTRSNTSLLHLKATTSQLEEPKALVEHHGTTCWAPIEYIQAGQHQAKERNILQRNQWDTTSMMLGVPRLQDWALFCLIKGKAQEHQSTSYHARDSQSLWE